MGWALTNPSSLSLRVPQQLLAQDQVVRPAASSIRVRPFLVVEPDLEVGRQGGIGAELVDIFEGDVVQAVALELLEEPVTVRGSSAARAGGRRDDQANEACDQDETTGNRQLDAT